MSAQVKRYAVKGVELCSGGAGYGLLEILWRGYTHISMLIVGGICFLMIIHLSKLSRCLLVKSLLGGLAITFAEFTVGCVVNLWLKLNVWDYSDEAFHLLGQICLKYTLLWVLLCALVMPLCKLASDNAVRLRGLLRPCRKLFYFFFKEEKVTKRTF